jgi:HEAT repeat protein
MPKAPPEYADLEGKALLGMFPEELGLVALYDKSAVRRLNAIQMLRGRGDVAVPMLVEVARKTSNDTSVPAAKALGDIASPIGSEALVALLVDVKTPLPLRVACAEALGATGDANQLTVLNLVRESPIPAELAKAVDGAIRKLAP